MEELSLEQLKKKLTPKQRRFCHQYIIDWNGARSMRDAGYSVKGARVEASKLLTKPNIQQYISLIKDNLEEEAGISKLRNVRELSKIAFSSIAHLHNTWIKLEEWEDIKAQNPDALDAVESIETKIETSPGIDPDSLELCSVEVKYVKVKLYSKIQALNQLNQMLGYNEAEKIKVKMKATSIKWGDQVIKV